MRFCLCQNSLLHGMGFTKVVNMLNAMYMYINFVLYSYFNIMDNCIQIAIIIRKLKFFSTLAMEMLSCLAIYIYIYIYMYDQKFNYLNTSKDPSTGNAIITNVNSSLVRQPLLCVGGAGAQDYVQPLRC